MRGAAPQLPGLDPGDPDPRFPPFFRDLEAMRRAGKDACRSAIFRMLKDLHVHGRESRYVEHLFGSVYELKPRARGREAGGARAYIVRIVGGRFALCRAECKHDTDADRAMLGWVARWVRALEERGDELID